MQTCSFKGRDELVTMLDRAVQMRDVERLTGQLKDGLVDLINQRGIELPEALCAPCSAAYGRRLLYRSEEHGYVVVAMIWGPGQGTPLHDHAGTWCVEGVLEGQIEVTQYDLKESQDGRFRFERLEPIFSGVGTAGTLIPPFEYHTIRNARSAATSITLHVYGLEMNRCTIFEPQDAGWYQRRSKALSYDN